jgi:hypothetical protein
MRKCLLMTLTLSLLICGIAGAATKPKPKLKPAKPAPKPSVQLAGDNGVFGTVYAIKKEGTLYFRLKSAEYTTDQVVMGDSLYVPKSDEKLLVLHFTVQNPQKSEQYVRWDSLNFTAVDSMNNNHDGNNDWGDDDAKDHAKIAMSMKPAQTINVLTVITVPAKGSIPKLMVLPGSDNGPVLRYIMNPDPKAPVQNKPGSLKAPIVDSADATGYTAIETVPGVVGTAYPYGNFDTTVEKFDYSTSAVGDYTPEDGGRLLLVTVLMKNESPSDQFLRYDTVAPVLTSTDGEELKYDDMFLATGNRPFAQNVKGLAEVRVRMLFEVPKDATPKTLALKENESRTYEFAVQ